MKALSLFSGIGGIDLACELAGIETVAFCEREPFPQKVLRKHWPDVPIYDDICKLTKERLIEDGIWPIELIHGGYPCQPFSNAGKRRGKEDDRHLWPEVRRLIETVRPRWFVGENVAGHVTLGLDDVLSDLEAIGYATRAFILPAAAVGAPHRRDRVFIVGYSKCSGCSGKPWWRTEPKPENGYIGMEVGNVANPSSEGLPIRGRSVWSKGNEETGTRMDNELERCSEVLANTSSSGQQERNTTSVTDRSGYYTWIDHAGRAIRATKSRMGGVLDGISARIDGRKWPAGRGQQQYDWEPPRVKSGVKHRVARLKALGNAVVPEQIYPIFAAIMQIETMNIR